MTRSRSRAWPMVLRRGVAGELSKLGREISSTAEGAGLTLMTMGPDHSQLALHRKC